MPSNIDLRLDKLRKPELEALCADLLEALQATRAHGDEIPPFLRGYLRQSAFHLEKLYGNPRAAALLREAIGAEAALGRGQLL